MDIASLTILILVFFLEVLYILFREPKMNNYNRYLIILSGIFSFIHLTGNTEIYNLFKFVSIVLLFLACVQLKHKPYEKPDWRYLLVLIETILVVSYEW